MKPAVRRSWEFPACDQGPRFFRCPGAVQRGAAGQGVCRERFIADIEANIDLMRVERPAEKV